MALLPPCLPVTNHVTFYKSGSLKGRWAKKDKVAAKKQEAVTGKVKFKLSVGGCYRSHNWVWGQSRSRWRPTAREASGRQTYWQEWGKGWGHASQNFPVKNSVTFHDIEHTKDILEADPHLERSVTIIWGIEKRHPAYCILKVSSLNYIRWVVTKKIKHFPDVSQV